MGKFQRPKRIGLWFLFILLPCLIPFLTAQADPTFPETPVLDSFNRSSVNLGKNWSGKTSGY